MIYFLGDVHGRFDRVAEAVRENRPDAVVFLGDLDCTRPLHEEVAEIRDLTEVWYIPGNHDSDAASSWGNLTCAEMADRNLHGRVVEIAGVRVAGLGGVFRGEIWYPPEPPQFDNYESWRRKEVPQSRQAALGDSPKKAAYLASKSARIGAERLLRHQSTIFVETVRALERQRADILVTHEAPSCHPMGFAALDEVARKLRVTRLFHGHHHDCLDYGPFVDAMGFRTIGVGLRGITDEEGRKVVEGELDAARAYRAPARRM